ncbi:MAG TPA: gfo/Idh/MocA family oxidoreductase, partial [Pirellulales bacterium]|nr:gfo/Idh/MocA family oxidoreductase [Pirellulales bacterium]
PISFEPSEKNITCLYENGVKLVLDFLPMPFGDRGPNWITKLGTCPVRFVGEEGSLETGDNGGTEVSSAALRGELLEAAGRVKGLDVSAHARNFFDCVKSRQLTVTNPEVMRNSHVACHAAALSWILKRKLSFDPLKQEFVGDDEANRLRSRPAREWS